jgi:hypothetical protein
MSTTRLIYYFSPSCSTRGQRLCRNLKALILGAIDGAGLDSSDGFGQAVADYLKLRPGRSRTVGTGVGGRSM